MPYSRVSKVSVTCEGLEEPAEIALHCYVPDHAPKALLYCLPGGACNAHYFDLSVSADASYSFARTMAAKGYLVVTVDYLGIGDSTTFQDGFFLTVERIVRANADALTKLWGDFRSLPQICVGHSMGAMLGLIQEAWFCGFDAMVLLGFGHGGIPGALCDFSKTFLNRPHDAIACDVEITKAQFGVGMLDLDFSEDNSVRSSCSHDMGKALQRKKAPLLAVPASLTLIPGSIYELSRQIRIPTFAAMGDSDICGDYKHQSDLTAKEVYSVQLGNTRHNHFVHQGRHQLYKELDSWIQRAILK